ncbi:GNAT family N-acetyltransferase [Mycetocola sp.]|uniref:GNAT family N-acetyltransferase n=1 Tax=Mycetocola sp. TaxID=1871042 RepID=UPI0039898CE7
MHSSLPRSTPSAHAVDARGIAAFLDALEDAPSIEPHSLMMLRDGHVIAEGWWAPYTADRVHLLYSLSKSFTSTAVAFAVHEGLLSLDDTVLSHFPELDQEITDARSRRMRIRHLLAMASGHREETLQRALDLDPSDLVRGFLLLPLDDEPGTVFAYNQPCTYTLSVIVQRVSGFSLTDYLRRRLFDPLGIDDVGWIRDSTGHELGFSGLHAQTEAIASLGQLYLQRGEWEGRQLLPAAWFDDATRSHVSNGSDPASDWEQGYGFQFWMARHGYRGDGAYGQFCVVLPDLGVVLAMTGQSEDMQGVLDLAWEHLLPSIGRPGDARGGKEADAALAARLASLALSPIPTGRIDDPVDGGSFGPSPDNALPRLTRIDVAPGQDADSVTLTLQEGESRLEVAARFGGWSTNDATAASAGWEQGGSQLSVDVIFLETPHRLHLRLDRPSSTFTARWETEHLHDPPLSSMRKPNHVPRVTVRAMDETEFDGWQQAIAHEYAEDQIAAGNWDRETALERALAGNAQLLPQGLHTPRMILVRAIRGDGEPVGRAWVGLDHPRGAPDTAFLYDILIDEAHRGLGLGKALLAEVENLVVENGVGALELNVFGHNATAVALYERTGYAVTTQQMRKRLN